MTLRWVVRRQKRVHNLGSQYDAFSLILISFFASSRSYISVSILACVSRPLELSVSGLYLSQYPNFLIFVSVTYPLPSSSLYIVLDDVLESVQAKKPHVYQTSNLDSYCKDTSLFI